MKNIRYLTPEEFVKRGEGFVNFGTAPDGIPWITQIGSPPKGASMLSTAEHVFSLRGAASDFAGTPLQAIVLSLDELIRRHYSQDIRMPDGGVFHATILPRSLKFLLGDTLLDRFLSSSPVRSYKHKTSLRAITSVAAERPLAPQFQIGEACLAFPDKGKTLSVVHMSHDRFGWPTFTFRRSFIQESAMAFSGGLFYLISEGQAVTKIPVADLKSYLDRRTDSHSGDWRLLVPRNSIGKVISNVAKAISQLHTHREIHGDIKPANILLDSSGVHLIDSLGLKEGDRAPALTRGWAAPEQVMATEVFPSTDQFPIGLMLLALVQGVLFGEETTIVVPTGGSEVERHTIFRSPGVYVDPNIGTIEKSSIRAWQKMIEHCLRFSPLERFASMNDFITELDSLLAAESLLGWCDCPLYFGQAWSAMAKNNKETPIWMAGM